VADVYEHGNHLQVINMLVISMTGEELLACQLEDYNIELIEAHYVKKKTLRTVTVTFLQVFRDVESFEPFLS
jgi:hypothetical protein